MLVCEKGFPHTYQQIWITFFNAIIPYIYNKFKKNRIWIFMCIFLFLILKQNNIWCVNFRTKNIEKKPIHLSFIISKV